MKFLAVLSVALFSTVLSLRAEVVVYKGLVRQTSFPAIKTAPVTRYFIVDTASAKYAAIDFNSSRSNKDRAALSSGTVHSTTATLGAKSASIYVLDDSGARLESDTNFFAVLIDLSGYDELLQLSTQGEKFKRPRILTLRANAAGVLGPVSGRATATGTLVFQQMLSRRENDAKHSVEQAAESIQSDLFGPVK